MLSGALGLLLHFVLETAKGYKKIYQIDISI